MRTVSSTACCRWNLTPNEEEVKTWIEERTWHSRIILSQHHVHQAIQSVFFSIVTDYFSFCWCCFSNWPKWGWKQQKYLRPSLCWLKEITISKWKKSSVHAHTHQYPGWWWWNGHFWLQIPLLALGQLRPVWPPLGQWGWVQQSWHELSGSLAETSWSPPEHFHTDMETSHSEHTWNGKAYAWEATTHFFCCTENTSNASFLNQCKIWNNVWSSQVTAKHELHWRQCKIEDATSDAIFRL